MPLIKRRIEPTELSRAHIGQGIRNELECVTNNTLANVIRQLSSLSKHAEDLFGELTKEATVVFQRSNNLQDRIDKLRVKVTQLDSTVAVVSLQDIHMRKPFKSSVIREQQIISKDSRPTAIQESYEKCDAPPALSKLNVYREDGKDSMKFYTDSTYFFELWRQEMEKDTENQRQEINKKKAEKKKRPAGRAPVAIRPVQPRRYDDMAMGKEFNKREVQQNHPAQNMHYENKSDRPSNLELPGDGEYLTPNHANARQSAAANHVQHGGPQYQSNDVGPRANGPIRNADMNAHVQQQSGGYPQEFTQDSDPRYNHESPHSSPVKQHVRGSVSSNIASPQRPMGAPPPPPSLGSPGMGNRVDSRNALPPPPPPPPLSNDDIHNSPLQSSHENTPSPLGHGSMTPGSTILPPPPPPVLDYSGDDPMGVMPPPPPSPPMAPSPPGATDGGMAPPPPPPPPPMGGIVPNPKPPAQPSPVAQPKKPAVKVPEPQDGRSDLLEAIRKGIQLRQVQQKQDQDQRRKSTSKLDVQSIMEAAFEMRRRAMEENDSDAEDDDDEEGDDWD